MGSPLENSVPKTAWFHRSLFTLRTPKHGSLRNTLVCVCWFLSLTSHGPEPVTGMLVNVTTGLDPSAHDGHHGGLETTAGHGWLMGQAAIVVGFTSP